MTPKQLKAKATAWRKTVEKVLAEHQEIESQMKNPDDNEAFVAVGMALGNLDSELEQLIDS